jgi:hypothetical protein
VESLTPAWTGRIAFGQIRIPVVLDEGPPPAQPGADLRITSCCERRDAPPPPAWSVRWLRPAKDGERAYAVLAAALARAGVVAWLSPEAGAEPDEWAAADTPLWSSAGGLAMSSAEADVAARTAPVTPDELCLAAQLIDTFPARAVPGRRPWGEPDDERRPREEAGGGAVVVQLAELRRRRAGA